MLTGPKEALTVLFHCISSLEMSEFSETEVLASLTAQKLLRAISTFRRHRGVKALCLAHNIRISENFD